MNRPVPFLLFSVMLLLFSVGTTVGQKLTLSWQTDTVFRVPDSVLTDPPRKVCYVSNIDGDPGEKEWDSNTGLLATPAGIYVADVRNGDFYWLKENKDLVTVFEIATGGDDGIVSVVNRNLRPCPEMAIRSDIFRQPHYDLYVSKMILYL